MPQKCTRVTRVQRGHDAISVMGLLDFSVECAPNARVAPHLTRERMRLDTQPTSNGCSVLRFSSGHLAARSDPDLKPD